MTDEIDGELSLGDNTYKADKVIWGKKLAGFFFFNLYFLIRFKLEN
jgi:hypothetical protein